MNNLYHYVYWSNGLQFVSTANPTVISLKTYFNGGGELPKCLGIWKYKQIKNK